MRFWAVAVALLATGCASVPVDLNQGGLPLGRSGWQLSGGADLDKKVWFVLFWKPWGARENAAAAMADQLVLPE
jgi:hypothetical protein